MSLMRFAVAASIVMSAAVAAGETPAEIEQVQRELQQFARDLHAAYVARDRAALDRLLADEFVWVHAFGYADDKATVIAEAMEDPVPPTLRVPDFRPPDRLHVSGDLAVSVAPDARTATGTPAWSTAVYIRRDGRWQLLQRQGTELNPTPAALPLSRDELGAYAGRYTSSDRQIELQLRPDGLYSVSDRFPPRRMVPVGPDLFTTKLGGEIRFERDPGGRVVRVTATGRGPPRTYGRAN